MFISVLVCYFIFILFISIRVFQRTNPDEFDSNQTKYCDQNVIRQYFMDDKRYLK